MDGYSIIELKLRLDRFPSPRWHSVRKSRLYGRFRHGFGPDMCGYRNATLHD